MSIENLARTLPSIQDLKGRSKALAMIDAILVPDWESRFYSFDHEWDNGEEMASMRNGSGDEYSIVFNVDGAYVRGFDHTSSLSPYTREPHSALLGLTNAVPDAFEQYVREPSFCDSAGIALLTVCLWRFAHDAEWQSGSSRDFEIQNVDDGSNWLFDSLVGDSSAKYVAHANQHYGVDLNAMAVQAIFRLEPISERAALRLNPALDWPELVDEAIQIGYPMG